MAPAPQQHQKVRVNLANAIFPFQSDLEGRTIIVAQYDQNYNYVDQIGETVKDRGIPQAFYMHNVLPTAQGYQSVAYDSDVAAMAGLPANFDTVFPLYYSNPSIRVLFSPSQGSNYIYDETVGNWASVSPLSAGAVNASTLVTTAFVQGITYIFYQQYGCYKYDTTTKLMDSVSLPALTVANIQGICSAMGYMICWDTNNTVYWSNIQSPTDFSPSVITGAGSEVPNGMNGNINFILPISNGFLIYCERNIVSATYTGNTEYPWAFLAVPGSGGVNSQEQVAYQGNAAVHTAWTTAGLQQVNLTSCADVYPEATEFFAKLIYEDFNETTLAFTTTYLSFPLYTKISNVANRYIIFSYGPTPIFSYALVFDLFLNRWGKLKISHVKAFEWNSPNPYGSITYGMLSALSYGQLATTTYGELLTAANSEEQVDKNIAFMDQNGYIQTLNLDLAGVTQAGTAADGVLLLGKFEFSRGKFITHQYTDVENVILGETFSMYLIPTVDGKTFLTPVQGTVISQGAKTIRFGGTVKGFNISILMIGAFNCVSLLTDFTLGGSK